MTDFRYADLFNIPIRCEPLERSGLVGWAGSLSWRGFWLVWWESVYLTLISNREYIEIKSKGYAVHGAVLAHFRSL